MEGFLQALLRKVRVSASERSQELVVLFLSGLCLRRAGCARLMDGRGMFGGGSQGRRGEGVLGSGTFPPCRRPASPAELLACVDAEGGLGLRGCAGSRARVGTALLSRRRGANRSGQPIHNVAGINARAAQCPEQTSTQLPLNQQGTPPASSRCSGQCPGPASAHVEIGTGDTGLVVLRRADRL